MPAAVLRCRVSESGACCPHDRRGVVRGAARSGRRRGTSSYRYGGGRLRSERPRPEPDGRRGVHGGRLPERSCTPSDRESWAYGRGDWLSRRAAAMHRSGRGGRQSPLADGGRRGSAAESGQDQPSNSGWRLERGRRSVVWHDPRDQRLPRGMSRASWSVPIVVDGRRAHISGELWRVPRPTPWPWLLIAALFAVLGGAVV